MAQSFKLSVEYKGAGRDRRKAKVNDGQNTVSDDNSLKEVKHKGL